MHHELKIDTAYFEAVKDGRKTFEIRFNDRGFNAGDTVELREQVNGCYTSERITKRIGYVSNFSQRENWVVFSLLPVEIPHDR